MECDVLVARAHRRRGCGTRLLQAICDETEDAGRSRLTWSTFDAVPAGDAFSRRIGARVARVNETSQLRLADVDWAMVERWRAAERARELGYHLELLAGPIPERRRADAVVFHHIMQTAPRDELDVGDVLIGEDFVVELDRLLEAIGRTHWTVFVRDAAGTCVGGTEVFFEAWEPEAVLQQNTGIDPAHRGLGLAKWAKAEMLDWVRRDRPLAERVRTGNASSNAAMLAINHALGFRTINVRTEWQVELDAVRRAVS